MLILILRRQASKIMIYYDSPQHSKEMYMDNNHVSALQAKHAGLDSKITKEEGRPAPDSAMLKDLKKEKLKVKEELLAH